MLKSIRLIGSSAFVIGFFVALFVAVPWIVTVSNDPVLGGPLPWWVKGAVYSLVGGIAVVLLTVALEKRSLVPDREPAPATDVEGIIVTNTDSMPGRDVSEVLGLVQGHTIYAVWLGRDISALVKLLLGGELTEYTEMMGHARSLAMHRMLAEAKVKGADAVINVRLTTTSVVGTAAELLVYGTAVKLKA